MTELFILAEKLVKKCNSSGITMATAESCTGGGLSYCITSVSGSSSVFWGGAVTYDNKAKKDILGVSSSTLEKYGAVSEKCVNEMLEGIKKISGADLVAAVSGIAGPSGGTEEKPVGTVYLGIANSYGEKIYKEVFTGDRDDVRYKSIDFLLNKMLENIHNQVLLDGSQ